MPLTVVAYVTNWCPDCTRSRRVLQNAGIGFVEIDIEATPGAEEEMRRLNGGSGKIPTIVLSGEGGRRVLIEPSDRELSLALEDAAETRRQPQQLASP